MSDETALQRGTKAADVAAEAIRRLIEDGALAPGQRLIEAELLERVPVARGTLREAFVKLAAAGLVEQRHQRGTCVRRLSRAALAEMFELREGLEGYAAGLAARRIAAGESAAFLREARAVWLGAAARANALAHMENNVPFHAGIVTLAGNRRLAQALAPLELPAYRLQFLRLLDRQQLEASAAEHLALIDALLAGKADRAEKLMRAHVRRAGQLAQRIVGLD
ncbi:MAG: GntR family transcriptional regulator [Gammaproteobacteria bacterium]|nr:GntR family transcriptional regulator [Gammaproteobacteria bacterium]